MPITETQGTQGRKDGGAGGAWGLSPPPPLLFTRMTFYFVLVRGTYEEIRKEEKENKNYCVEI